MTKPNFVKIVSLSYLKELGYDITNLICDYCHKKIRAKPFDFHHEEVINGKHFFENTSTKTHFIVCNPICKNQLIYSLQKP